MFLMPTLLADQPFLWVDLERHRPGSQICAGRCLSLSPAVHRGLVAISPSPKVDEYSPNCPCSIYLFMVIHAVDYSRKDGVFATKELDFFLGA